MSTTSVLHRHACRHMCGGGGGGDSGPELKRFTGREIENNTQKEKLKTFKLLLEKYRNLLGSFSS